MKSYTELGPPVVTTVLDWTLPLTQTFLGEDCVTGQKNVAWEARLDLPTVQLELKLPEDIRSKYQTNDEGA